MTQQQDCPSLTFKEVVGLLARFVWPVVLAFSVFMYAELQGVKVDLASLNLKIAEEYATKEDLQDMLDRLENRLNKRLDQVVDIIKP